MNDTLSAALYRLKDIVFLGKDTTVVVTLSSPFSNLSRRQRAKRPDGNHSHRGAEFV